MGCSPGPRQARILRDKLVVSEPDQALTFFVMRLVDHLNALGQTPPHQLLQTFSGSPSYGYMGVGYAPGSFGYALRLWVSRHAV